MAVNLYSTQIRIVGVYLLFPGEISLLLVFVVGSMLFVVYNGFHWRYWFIQDFRFSESRAFIWIRHWVNLCKIFYGVHSVEIILF